MGYSKRLNHGEAVILGIKSACEFSFTKKILSKIDYILIKNHITKINKSLNLKKFFGKKDVNKIVKFMISDKKNINKDINLILLKKISKPAYKNFFKVSDVKKFTKNQLSNT